VTVTAPYLELAPEPAADGEPDSADINVLDLVLDVVNRQARNLDAHIANSIISGEIERTIDGASTLTITVHDPDRALLRSGMFDFPYTVNVRLDRLQFRLCKVSKQDTDLTLTFEDLQVSELRAHRKPRKASRSAVTRAEFVLSLVREVRPPIKFICPELHVRQPLGITNARLRLNASTRARQRKPGLNQDVRALTIGGAPADKGQIANLERVLDVASSQMAPDKATLALVEACIVESSCRNLDHGDRDSLGILQVRQSTAQGMRIASRDVEACANAFLTRGFYGKGGAISLARKHPDWTAGEIAQACQGSAFPGRYDQVKGEAQKILAAYGGGLGGSGGFTEQVVDSNYTFRRGSTNGKPEDSWTCIQRLASEVQWHAFMSAGALYFISDPQLMKAKPRLVLHEYEDGVGAIDFDIDQGKVKSDVTVTCRASRWIAAPGAVVQIEDCGPADGRWLIHSIRRGLYDANATIMLKRPVAPLPEPVSLKTVPVTGKVSHSNPYKASLDKRTALVYQACLAMDSKRYPYVWGGGHYACGIADKGAGGSLVGFDCSGSTCAVLAAANLGFSSGGPVDVSGTIAAKWGQPGEGRTFTVWANSVHVFIIFNTPKGKQHFGTGDWGKGWGGAGFNPNMHPTAGFTPRHWPGL
jgi:hypothetical protein